MIHWTCKEDYITNTVGLITSLIGLTALIESQLQVKIFGEQLPLVKGTILALFTISFGLTLMTQGATTALQKTLKKL